MKIVIQCAGAKQIGVGYFRTAMGKPILFVSRPNLAPTDDDLVYARPDDMSDVPGKSWRTRVSEYNEMTGNPYGLLPAFGLYRAHAYDLLVGHFGPENVFVLSAGWGLVRSDFLTPQYDISFNNQADDHVRRQRTDRFADYVQIPDRARDPVVFFGGTNYLAQFCALTANLRCDRFVFFNTQGAVHAPGCHLKRYETNRRQNWHYSCVEDFVAGRIGL